MVLNNTGTRLLISSFSFSKFNLFDYLIARFIFAHCSRWNNSALVIGAIAVSPSQNCAANNTLSRNNYLRLSTKTRANMPPRRRPMHIGL